MIVEMWDASGQLVLEAVVGNATQENIPEFVDVVVALLM